MRPDYVTFNGRSAQYATAPILVGVPVGGGAVFEVRLAEPGDYPFVSHAFADATKGVGGPARQVMIEASSPQAGIATRP